MSNFPGCSLRRLRPQIRSMGGKVMGYERIITYTLDTEPGTSLRASGWTCAGPAGGKRWTGKRKPITDLYPAQMKLRYEKILKEGGESL